MPACADLQGDPPAELLDALRAAHARGARIASICTGAFTLAAAGLLDGRRATTHWMHGDELTRRWPAVCLDQNVLYTQDGRIFTSAGECAGLDLCLHLIRLDHGSRVANALARRMVIPPHRDDGQAQYIDSPIRGTGSDRLGPVLDWARQHLDEPLTIDDLAAAAAMSQRTFLRHFRAVTATTPLQWLVHERVARARELLETTDDTIDRIAERCASAPPPACGPTSPGSTRSGRTRTDRPFGPDPSPDTVPGTAFRAPSGDGHGCARQPVVRATAVSTVRRRPVQGLIRQQVLRSSWCRRYGRACEAWVGASQPRW